MHSLTCRMECRHPNICSSTLYLGHRTIPTSAIVTLRTAPIFVRYRRIATLAALPNVGVLFLGQHLIGYIWVLSRRTCCSRPRPVKANHNVRSNVINFTRVTLANPASVPEVFLIGVHLGRRGRTQLKHVVAHGRKLSCLPHYGSFRVYLYFWIQNIKSSLLATTKRCVR
ncbi:hypothetical protein BKA63DRAFT_515693 [Paraphoma chrysanthemicola]|nr:hypothetical protein BKA63DRAFT_515693 [Paraphoma chrysanthemicola]